MPVLSKFQALDADCTESKEEEKYPMPTQAMVQQQISTPVDPLPNSAHAVAVEVDSTKKPTRPPISAGRPARAEKNNSAAVKPEQTKGPKPKSGEQPPVIKKTAAAAPVAATNATTVAQPAQGKTTPLINEPVKSKCFYEGKYTCKLGVACETHGSRNAAHLAAVAAEKPATIPALVAKPVELNNSDKVCRGFLKGFCAYGDKCRFTHSTSPIRDAPASAACKEESRTPTQIYSSEISDIINEAAATRARASLSVIGGMVQHRKEVVCPWFISKSSLSYLETVLPQYFFVAAEKQTPHPHPCLNLERALAEQEAYAYIRKHLKTFGAKYDDGQCIFPDGTKHMVHDVGGNPNRHLKMNRVVHCSNPQISSADVLRYASRKGRSNVCSHTAQRCTCVSVSAYLCVDSIYYLSPIEIAALVDRSKSRMLVSSHHVFDHAFGSFGGGEASYHLTATDEVSMSVKGNSHSYNHSAMLFLKSNGFRYVTQSGESRTLVWSQFSTIGSHCLFAFTTTATAIQLDTPFSTLFTPALQNAGYYGPVTLAGAFNDAATAEVVGDLISLPHVSVFSWGSSVILYESVRDLHILCPKGLIDEVATWVCGKTRSKENWAACLAYVRYKSKAYNIPLGLLSNCLFGAAAIGFTRGVAFEAGVLHSVVAPLLPTIEAHTAATAFNFQRVWTWKRAAVAVMVGAIAVSTAAATAGTLFGAAAAAYTSAATISAAGIYVGNKLSGRSYVSRGAPTSSSETQFVNYRTDRSSNPPRTAVVPITKGTTLPATEAVLKPSQLAAPIAEHSSITIMDNTSTREVAHLGPLVPIGIVSTMCIPVVPSNSAASSVAAITSRVIKMSPYDKGLCSDQFLKLFEEYVFAPGNLESIDIMPQSLEPLSFEEWNACYPSNQQKVHIDALKQLGAGHLMESLVNQRGEFVKIEGLAKSTTEGVASLAPRAIQSGTPVHNVATGPSMKAFSKLLAKAWKVTAESCKGAKYTSGATSEQIGALFKRAVESLGGDLTLLEGDFARFDSTIHRKLLELEARVYKYTGMSQTAIHSLLAGIRTRGRDKWGNKYKTDGGRHSGDHNTSCGNTLLQVLAILFCLAYHSASGGLLPNFRSVIEEYDLTLFALGDDNLGVGNSKLASVPLKDLLLKLGLELEPKLHVGPTAVYRATFCSARFWNTEGGECVLAAGPGRTLSKSGYVVNPPVGVDTDALARGDALGRYQDNSAVPFSRLYWERVIQLTAGVQAVTSNTMKRDAKHATHATKAHRPSDDAYAMVESLYGLTRAHEQEYYELLQKVTSLPCVVDYEPMAIAMAVDGMLEGSGHEYEHAIETLPTILEDEFVTQVDVHLQRFERAPSAVPCLSCHKNVGICAHLTTDVVLQDDHSSAATESFGCSDMSLAGPHHQGMA